MLSSPVVTLSVLQVFTFDRKYLNLSRQSTRVSPGKPVLYYTHLRCKCCSKMKTFVCFLICCVAFIDIRAENVTQKTKDDGLVKECGDKKNNCTCSYYDDEELSLKLDCSHKGFVKMLTSSMLPPKVAEIEMKLNRIVNLQQLEPNEYLKRLSLETNNLKKLDNYAFEHTPNLIFVDLSYNEIREVPETIFGALSDLQFLNLSHNLLRSIPKNLFRQTKMLSELNLSNNPIKYIVGDQFLNLDKLYSLNLAHNEIFSLASDIFNGLTALTDLDLSRNEFEAVPNNALRLVHKLHRLDLSHNPIRVIGQSSFRGMRTLRHLAINQMKHLYAIEHNAFSDLTDLEHLYIEDNSVLAYIDQYAFSGMFNNTWLALKFFSFRRNHLSHLHEKTLPFCKLKTIFFIHFQIHNVF